MPTICRFLGIAIKMFYNEHNPPHFHVEYNEYKASIDIRTLGINQWKLPPKVASLVVERAIIHQQELMDNRDLAQKKTGETLHMIEPLE